MHIIADFSKTFTSPDMPTTWSVFAKSGILGSEYSALRDALYAEYKLYEDAGDIAKTREWFYGHACLFQKYCLTQDQINQVLLDDTYFAPRDGVDTFLQYIQDQNISLSIVTSGVANFVERWFELRYHFTPERVYGTRLEFDSLGSVSGVIESSVICPLDKNIDTQIQFGSDEKIIVLGDSLEDTKVVTEKDRTIGFVEKGDLAYGISVGKYASMSDVIQYL